MADVATTIELDVVVTLADQVRFTEWTLDRPALVWRRVAIRACFVLALPFVGVVLGVASAAWEDDLPFGPALSDVMSDVGTLRIVATISGALIVLYVLLRVLRRPLLRRHMRRLLVERPGVDPADPALSEAANMTVGPDGFTNRTAAATISLGWAGIKGLDDAGTVLALKTGRASGYIIPKRNVSAEQIETLYAMVRAGTGG